MSDWRISTWIQPLLRAQREGEQEREEAATPAPPQKPEKLEDPEKIFRRFISKRRQDRIHAVQSWLFTLVLLTGVISALKDVAMGTFDFSEWEFLLRLVLRLWLGA